MLKTLLAALGGFLLAGVAPAAPVYVMRHLERDPGTDPVLNAVGAGNAVRLADWFARDRPTAIFVTPFKRARETVTPLAAKLCITPQDYDPREPEAMLAKVREAKGPVLIVGHSNTVPKIVEALGGPAAADLADDDYGRIWIVRDGKVAVAKLAMPQPR